MDKGEHVVIIYLRYVFRWGVFLFIFSTDISI